MCMCVFLNGWLVEQSFSETERGTQAGRGNHCHIARLPQGQQRVLLRLHSLRTDPDVLCTQSARLDSHQEGGLCLRALMCPRMASLKSCAEHEKFVTRNTVLSPYTGPAQRVKHH